MTSALVTTQGAQIAGSNPIRLVQTQAELVVLREWLAARTGEWLGLDSETNALDPWDQGFAVRTVQIADTHTSWVVDVAAIGIPDTAALVRGHRTWVAHFSEAEVRFFVRGLPGALDLDCDVPHVIDLQVVLAWYDPRTVVPQGTDKVDPRIARPKGLKPTSARELDDGLETAEQALHAWFRDHAPVGHRTPTKSKTWGFAHIPVDAPEFVTYAGLDPLYTIHLFRKFRAELERRGVWQGAGLRDDLATQWDIDRATARGVPVDGDYARWLDAQLQGTIDHFATLLAEYGVKPTGMGPQIGLALSRMGVVSPKTSMKTGAPSWDAAVLKAVAKGTHSLAADLALSVLAVRRAVKFRAAYVAPMLDSLSRDSRIHCSMRAVGTVTSRMSAANPAVQQLPKKDTRVRAAYGGRDGWVFVSCDFAQGEPRTMAALSGDSNYIAAVNSGDINNAVATETFGDAFNPAEGKTAGTPSYLMRQGCKAGFLAKCYGGGVSTVSAALGVDPAEGSAVIARWESAYSRMFARSAYLNQGTYIQLENGWTAPLWDRYSVDDATGELLLKPYPSRKAMNYETQGSQRVYLVRAWRELVARGWAWALAMFMHDEIVLYVPEFMAADAQRDLAECMTLPLANGVTMLCEATIDGRTWLPQPDEFRLSAEDLADYVDA